MPALAVTLIYISWPTSKHRVFSGGLIHIQILVKQDGCLQNHFANATTSWTELLMGELNSPRSLRLGGEYFFHANCKMNGAYFCLQAQ